MRQRCGASCPASRRPCPSRRSAPTRWAGRPRFLFTARTTDELMHAVRVARALDVPRHRPRPGHQRARRRRRPARPRRARPQRPAARSTGELLSVEAGAELPALVTDLAGQGLAGLEFAGNIPGSVGGAVVGNAGAYGRAVSDVLVDVAPARRPHASTPRSPAELDFGYRTSLLKRRPELIVLSATFALVRGERERAARRDRPRRRAAAQQAPARVRLLRQLLQEPVARAAGRPSHRGGRPQGPHRRQRRA